MDILKMEMERKKKEREALANSTSGGGTKFFRRGDLAKLEEEKRRQEQERLIREREEARKKKEEEEAAAELSLQAKLARGAEMFQKKSGGGKRDSSGRGRDDTKASDEKGDTGALDRSASGSDSLTVDEVKMRLRLLGLPITLFGESDEQRIQRLRTAESEDYSAEFALSGGFELRNEALDRRKSEGMAHDVERHDHEDDDDDDDDKRGDKSSDSSDEGEGGGRRKKGRSGKKRKRAGDGDSSATDNSDVEGSAGGSGDGRRPAKAKAMHPDKRIRSYFRGLIKQWEQDLNARPDELKRTLQGKQETRIQKQCKDYIRPLFKLCKARHVPELIRANLIEMINFCEDGEFVKAHEVYLKTAIGNAPWPIGLTMVGIHERTGREKISSNKVAHIMNNELQRKYLTSVKRLMKYAQDKRPDVDPSKKVLN